MVSKMPFPQRKEGDAVKCCYRCLHHSCAALSCNSAQQRCASSECTPGWGKPTSSPGPPRHSAPHDLPTNPPPPLFTAPRHTMQQTCPQRARGRGGGGKQTAIAWSITPAPPQPIPPRIPEKTYLGGPKPTSSLGPPRSGRSPYRSSRSTKPAPRPPAAHNRGQDSSTMCVRPGTQALCSYADRTETADHAPTGMQSSASVKVQQLRCKAAVPPLPYCCSCTAAVVPPQLYCR